MDQNVLELLERFVVAVEEVGTQLKMLGNGNALQKEGVEVGALEGLAIEVRDGLNSIANSIESKE